MPLVKKIKQEKPPTVSLKDFHEIKNKLLILRETGGLGDILMHRMMFEDFKKICPDIELTFACPQKYHDAVKDHPFIDHVIDSKDVDTSNYNIFYNTTGACNKHEYAAAPFSSKNRSDIWANHCGVMLTSHNMHLKIDEKTLAVGKKILNNYFNGPTAIIAPVSAMVVKNLTENQILSVVTNLKNRGCNVLAIHDKPIPNLPVPLLHGLNLKEWMGVIAASDYVVSVDTSTFHLAGGLGKPLVGIFTFADGKVYGKWYPQFILVQKHRDDGNWDCGPCYAWSRCPKTRDKPKPCLIEIKEDMIAVGINKMFDKFPLKDINI